MSNADLSTNAFGLRGALSRPALALGAFSLFFLSFLMSGNGNALPQLFFQRNDPAHKTLLLSAALLSCTVVAFVAVLISRRLNMSRAAVVGAVLVTATLAVAQLSTDTALIFVACLVLVQGGDNFLLSQIDHAAVARAGALRGFNDAVGNAARLLGMLAAPAFFTMFSSHPNIERVVVAGLGAVAGLGCLRLFAVRPTEETTTQAARDRHAPERLDGLVFGYAVAIYVSLYLFAANTIYLLRDLFHVPGAEQRGGLAIVLIFAAALCANGVIAAARRSVAARAARELPVSVLAAPALLLIVAASAIALGVRVGYPLFLAGGLLIGAAYGVFMWEVRDYSSRAARQGKTDLLTWFNNMANLSSLIAFALMLALAAARSRSPGTYYVWLMWAIASVPVAGLFLLIYAAWVGRRLPSTQRS